MYCLQCDCSLQRDVFNYSTNYFGVPLCRTHQNWIKDQLNRSTATLEAINLYFALREFGIPAELEKHDGFKTIDIAIEEAKVHIEIDGGHHNYNSLQAMSDLKRTYYSFKQGYFTLRIPNSLIRKNLDEAVDYIVEILELNRSRNEKKRFSIFKFFKF